MTSKRGAPAPQCPSSRTSKPSSVSEMPETPETDASAAEQSDVAPNFCRYSAWLEPPASGRPCPATQADATASVAGGLAGPQSPAVPTKVPGLTVMLGPAALATASEPSVSANVTAASRATLHITVASSFGGCECHRFGTRSATNMAADRRHQNITQCVRFCYGEVGLSADRERGAAPSLAPGRIPRGRRADFQADPRRSGGAQRLISASGSSAEPGGRAGGSAAGRSASSSATPRRAGAAQRANGSADIWSSVEDAGTAPIAGSCPSAASFRWPSGEESGCGPASAGPRPSREVA